MDEQRIERVAKAAFEMATGQPWAECIETVRPDWLRQAALFIVQFDAALVGLGA